MCPTPPALFRRYAGFGRRLRSHTPRRAHTMVVPLQPAQTKMAVASNMALTLAPIIPPVNRFWPAAGVKLENPLLS